MKSFCKSLSGLFPCFKPGEGVKEGDMETYLNEFVNQLQQDKNEHLMKKVDIDMISMELNNVIIEYWADYWLV